jgi:hypothetical protein
LNPSKYVFGNKRINNFPQHKSGVIEKMFKQETLASLSLTFLSAVNRLKNDLDLSLRLPAE